MTKKTCFEDIGQDDIESQWTFIIQQYCSIAK